MHGLGVSATRPLGLRVGEGECDGAFAGVLAGAGLVVAR